MIKCNVLSKKQESGNEAKYGICYPKGIMLKPILVVTDYFKCLP